MINLLLHGELIIIKNLEKGNNMSKFEAALDLACAKLRKTDFLGRSLIRGFEEWNTDSKSKRFGNSDAMQKKRAIEAINSVGLTVIQNQLGKRVTAMPVAVDDYGNQVYLSTSGMLVQKLKQRTGVL